MCLEGAEYNPAASPRTVGDFCRALLDDLEARKHIRLVTPWLLSISSTAADVPPNPREYPGGCQFLSSDGLEAAWCFRSYASAAAVVFIEPFLGLLGHAFRCVSVD